MDKSKGNTASCLEQRTARFSTVEDGPLRDAAAVHIYPGPGLTVETRAAIDKHRFVRCFIGGLFFGNDRQSIPRNYDSPTLRWALATADRVRLYKLRVQAQAPAAETHSYYLDRLRIRSVVARRVTVIMVPDEWVPKWMPWLEAWPRPIDVWAASRGLPKSELDGFDYRRAA